MPLQQQVNNWATANQTYPQAPFPGLSRIPGKMITSLKDIKPQDVPMDGTPAIFPTFDGNTIYVKCFDATCDMKTYEYILNPNVQQQLPEQPKDPMAVILDRLDKIEHQINGQTGANAYYGKEESK